MSVLALFKTGGTTAKTRGAICLFIGYLALFVMDPDAAVDINHGVFYKCKFLFNLFSGETCSSKWTKSYQLSCD